MAELMSIFWGVPVLAGAGVTLLPEAMVGVAIPAAKAYWVEVVLTVK